MGHQLLLPKEARFESSDDQVGISDGNLKRSWVAMHIAGGAVVNHCARQPASFLLYYTFDGLI